MSPASGALVGQVLDGRYQVQAPLGYGGMAEVYQALHLAMGQSVAIKVLGVDGASEPGAAQRFLREAQATFRLDNPHCVRVTDFGSLDDGSLYMVMEHLNGRTLADELASDGPIAPKRVESIVAQIAEALEHAHQLGLIHRDLKPANIMLISRHGNPDYVKVFDFGIAAIFDGGARLSGVSISPLTQQGMIFGTPEYMSPEQALGETLSPKSDIYSLGVCAYEMLTGQKLYQGATFTEVLQKQVQHTPMPPSAKQPAVPPSTDKWVMDCLRKKVELRLDAKSLVNVIGQRAPVASAAPSPKPSTSDETLFLGQSQEPSTALVSNRKQSPIPLIVAMMLPLVGALIYWQMQSGPKPSTRSAAALPIADAGVVRPSTIGSDASGLPSLDAGIASASQTPNGPTSKTSVERSKGKSDPHLLAAEAAYKKKNLLKQLSEAKAALAAQPRSRRAAFLVGDALSRSGDKVRACTYFRRSGKKHWRAAGCAN